MTLRRPTTVFRCIIPVKKRFTTFSAIYHSLFKNSRKRVRLPYPAWPEIDDSNQPCCLPTLLRAVYFLNRGTIKGSKEAAIRAEIYVSQLEGFEPEVIKQAIDLIKAHQSFSHRLSEVTDQPSILFGFQPRYTPERITKQAEVYEVFMQGLIYGNLGNFYGNEEAYADAHEYAHNIPRKYYSGVVLNELSKIVHESIGRLAGDKSLSREEIDQLWEGFSATNQYMSELAKKFEPVEEIFATYMGMRFSPPQVRNAVRRFVKEELGKRNWLEAYEAFTEACENSNRPGFSAVVLFELVCRMLGKIDMDGAKLLEKLLEIQESVWIFYAKIGVINPQYDLTEDELEDIVKKCQLLLEQSNIPYEVLLSVCETMRDYKIFKRPLEDTEDLEDIEDADITLIGYHEDKYIFPIFIYEEQDFETNISDPEIRLAMESLRQQLSQVCGILCPYTYMKKCCGLKEDINRLYERLPEEVKRNFETPNCDLHR